MMISNDDSGPWVKEVALAASVVVGPLVIPTNSAPKAHQVSRATAPPLRPEGLAATASTQSSSTARESTTTTAPNLSPDPQIRPNLPLRSKSSTSLPSEVSSAVNQSTEASFGFSDLPHPWDCIAMRESSDRVVATNTESGDEGALQFALSTWLEYRPSGYPATPNEATLWQQYQVALRLEAVDGYAPWVTASLCGV